MANCISIDSMLSHRLLPVGFALHDDVGEVLGYAVKTLAINSCIN